MNWDENDIKPTSRSVIWAAISDRLRTNIILNEIIGSALPGDYGSYQHRRDAWSAKHVY